MKIENKVIGLLSQMLNVPIEHVKLKAEIRDDLGADSLDMVDLVIWLEDNYDIEINDENAEKIITVQDAIDFIKNENN